MSDIMYNLQFEKLCEALMLGEILNEPKAICGGLLHRMYSIETTKGKYAIKALNPQIMLRPLVNENYIISEGVATVAAKQIPALPAKKFNGACLQKIDKQFYLVFDWVEGKSLMCNEIKELHCEKIGAILGDIHKMDFSHLDIIKEKPDDSQTTEWKFYLQKGEEIDAPWVNQLSDIINDIYHWNEEANLAAVILAEDVVISHRDLDPKNVMWNREKPIIIDWESAGYINPMQDLIETAIYWSENERGKVDGKKLKAFISGYQKRKEIAQVDWKKVLTSGFSGKLGWLEYNLKRSLWIECTDEKEQQMGTAQVIGTIKAIKIYAEMTSDLEKWLNDKSI